MVGLVIYSVLSQSVALHQDLWYNDEKNDICRVFPLRAPQNTPKPYVIYRVIGDNPNNIKDSVSPTETNRVDLAIIAETYVEAITLDNKIRKELDQNVRGEIMGVNVRFVAFENKEDRYADDDRQFIRISTYKINILK